MVSGDNPASTKEKLFYGYVIVLAASLISLIAWGPTAAFGIFIKPLQADFDWSRAAISIAFSLLMFFRGIFHIVAGRMTDRFGPRIVVTVCTVFLGLGYILMSQISALWQLYLFYGVIIAVGVSGAYVPLVSTVARWFVKRRSTMTGIVMAGISMGTVVTPPAVEWLISTYGWRTTVNIISAISLVSIILLAQLLKRSPAQVGLQPYGSTEAKNKLNLQATGFSFRQAFHTRQFWLLNVMLFCHWLCVQAIFVHIIPHATDLGITPIIAATMLTIIGGMSLGGRIFIGGIADRIGNKRTVIISSVLLSGSLLWLLVARELWMLYLFVVVFGVAYAGVYTLGSPMVAELFGLRAHGAIVGITTFAGTVGGAIGPAMAGYIFDVSKSYHLAFLLSIIISIIGLIAVLLIIPINKARR